MQPRGARPYRQVFLPEDQVRQISTWQREEGWPLHWEGIPALRLAALDVHVDELMSRTGLSFSQRVDLGDGLGDLPRAIVALPSGLRVAFSTHLFQQLPPAPDDPLARVISLDADPTSVKRPFVEGVHGEAIIEHYRDALDER